MKVAAVQFAPEFRKKTANISRLVSLVTSAAKAGAKLIVLPELCTTGYSYMSKAEAREDAEVVTLETSSVGPNYTMRVMFALASKLDVTIVWGMVTIDPGSKKLQNSQVYLEPSGFFEAYAKVNPWGSDFLWITPGISNPPVVTAEHLGGLRIGMLICRDVRDKKDDDWKNFYSAGDADVICLSTNWGNGGFPAVAWVDFVEDNKTALIVSNRYGKEANNDFGEGGVCVISKSGEVSCEGLLWGQDCIVYAEV